MSFSTKLDYSNNRQIKQFQLTNTQLSGTTTFGILDALIPENFSGVTINIDALQNIQTRGLIFPNPIQAFTGSTYQLLGRDNDTGKVVEVSGYSGGTINTNDYVTGATFNTSDGVLTLTRLSGATVTVDLDDRYSLTGHTHGISQITGFTDNSTQWNNAYNNTITGITVTGTTTKTITLSQQDGGLLQANFTDNGGTNTNDYVTGATFNTTNGILTLARLSGGTVTVDLDGKYANDNEVVKLSGNQSITGGTKTFSIVPKSLQDASSANDLVRLSQLNSSHLIPMTYYTTNTCFSILNVYLSRFVCGVASSPEYCVLADVIDVDKEVIFTNLSTSSVTASVSGSAYYNKVRTGFDVPITSWLAKTWIRVRVQLYLGAPYFLILEQGTIT